MKLLKLAMSELKRIACCPRRTRLLALDLAALHVLATAAIAAGYGHWLLPLATLLAAVAAAVVAQAAQQAAHRAAQLEALKKKIAHGYMACFQALRDKADMTEEPIGRTWYVDVGGQQFNNKETGNE